MESLISDLRFGVRMLARNRGFAAAAITTLALGIGANTAVFSAIDSVLLRPLPFKDPGRLVLVSEFNGNVPKTGSPLLRYRARAAESTVFEESGAYWNVSGGNGLVFGDGSAAERLQFSIVTNSLFDVLGVRPSLGRTFLPAEEAPGGAKVFLASDALWHRLLGGDSHAIGRTYRLDGVPYTLIGVLPGDPAGRFPAGCDIWMPVGTMGTWPLADRVSHQFCMVDRLRPGVTVALAQAHLDAIQSRLAQAYPATDAEWQVRVRPLLEDFVGNVRASLWVLFGAVGFVLLIACTNVINLLLARTVVREKEFAVRAALGAERQRLVWQALSETVLLVTGGTVLGLLLAAAGLRAIVALAGASIPRFDAPGLNGAVLGFSLGTAVLVSLLVGVAPGIHASALSLADTLQEGSRAGTSRRSARLRNLLVVGEVALTLVLLSGAGIMLRSFLALREVDPGFRPDGIVSLRIALPNAAYPKAEQRTTFLAALLGKLHDTPGIATVAATDRLPLAGEGNWNGINIEGRPQLDAAHAPNVEVRQVSPNYFAAMGMPLVHGRAFTDADVAAGRRVTVINQEFAMRFFPNEDPIGHRIGSPYDPGRWAEIIGVVGNIKDFALDQATPPEMYSLPGWWNEMELVLRGRGTDAALVAAVKRQVTALDPEVPVYDVVRLSDLVRRSMGRQRFELFLLGLFASVALLLACVGIYGVLAFVVSRRTRVIGLRIALGARPVDVLALVMGQGLALVLAGEAIGIGASFALSDVMAGMLYQTSPLDPLTFGVMTGILTAVGALACLVPARRAMRVDPMVALRAD